MTALSICRFIGTGSTPELGVVVGNNVYVLPDTSLAVLLSELERQPDATYARLEAATAASAICSWSALEAGNAAAYRLLAPLDAQEVWAAGVTY